MPNLVVTWRLPLGKVVVAGECDVVATEEAELAAAGCAASDLVALLARFPRLQAAVRAALPRHATNLMMPAVPRRDASN
jgi:hypothetical protein